MTAGLLAVLFGGGVVLASPAAAATGDSPAGRVTHGPSCRPGGLVVEVTAGDAPYFVRLATTRTPGGEDEASLDPGETVVLRSDDVAWGETIDGRLEYAARDGSGATSVDELEFYSFTRPTREDCDAIRNPPKPKPAPTTSPSSPSAAPSGAGTSTRPTQPATTPSSTPPPAGSSAGGVRESEAAATSIAERTDGAVGAVAARDQVSVRGSGYFAGERVQVAGSSAPVGDSGAATLVPLAAAAVALVGAAGGLISAVGRRASRRR